MDAIRSWVLLSLTLALGCSPTRVPLKALGEYCASTLAPGETSSECAEGLCVALDSSSGFCTRTCSAENACPLGFECTAAGKYGEICKPTEGCTGDLDCPSGHVCNTKSGNCYIRATRTLCSPCQDSAECPTGGVCFTALGSLERFCTAACGAGDACPGGFECREIPGGDDGEVVKQCVPSTMSCNAGKQLCSPCRGDVECGGPYDLCVRNLVSDEMFCGRDCDPKRNICPTPGCDPLALDSAEHPDCPRGFSCTNLGQGTEVGQRGPYQCVPNSNSCSSFCDSTTELNQLRQCGLGKTCDLELSQCVAASDGRMCAPCSDNDECRSGSKPENRCIVNNCPDCPFKGESFCSSPCLDDAACVRSFGLGFVCQPVVESSGGSRKFCMPQRGSCQVGIGRLGDDCSSNGASDCLAGLCISGGKNSFCSAPCSTDSDCGEGQYLCCEVSGESYDCSAAVRSGQAPRSGSGICAPRGGLLGDDCSPGRPPCQSGTCLDLGTARVCTLLCDEGCPEGYGCRKAVVLGSETSLEICFPAGGGQIGSNCDFGPAACESGLCIRKESGSVCTGICNSSEDCPVDWMCGALTTVDGRLLDGCVPPSLQ